MKLAFKNQSISVWNQSKTVAKNIKASVCGGLAVHPCAYEADGDGWTISHIASGGAIASGLDTKEMACEIATAAMAITDWTRGEEEIKNDADARLKLIELFKGWSDKSEAAYESARKIKKYHNRKTKK